MKTVLGLFNDTQDMEFLHTWALLPQGDVSARPARVTIAHIGADVYGTMPLGKAGSVAYTGYVGISPGRHHGGYRYGIEDAASTSRATSPAAACGFDVRWTTPVEGLMVGYSFIQTRDNADLVVTGRSCRAAARSTQPGARASRSTATISTTASARSPAEWRRRVRPILTLVRRPYIRPRQTADRAPGSPPAAIA